MDNIAVLDGFKAIYDIEYANTFHGQVNKKDAKKGA
jgi:hypothetical protein